MKIKVKSDSSKSSVIHECSVTDEQLEFLKKINKQGCIQYKDLDKVKEEEEYNKFIAPLQRIKLLEEVKTTKVPTYQITASGKQALKTLNS